MSQISINTNPISRTELASRYGAETSTRRATDTAGVRAPDRVEVSDAARLAAEDPRPVRLNLVQRIREQIASGTYETDDKVAVASHEMARALRGEV
jgi:anti-sigma28 factor (negative regulator of flagellin synthesis)